MDKENLEKAIQSTKGALAIERLHLTGQEEKLIKQRLNEELSEEEFKQEVLRGR